MTVPEIIAELRRQSAMRNATWPCMLLKDLMPLCDEIERLQSLGAEERKPQLIERGCNLCNNMIPPYNHSGERCPMLTREMRPSERARQSGKAQDGD